MLAVTFCLMDRIDTTLSPGPKRPYNFFGSLTAYQFSEVHELLKTTGTEPSDGLVVFGHYPLSTVVSPSPGIKEVRLGWNCCITPTMIWISWQNNAHDDVGFTEVTFL